MTSQTLLLDQPADSTDSPRRLKTTRVLHLINGEHFAGAERVQDLLAGRLPELGFEPAFACLKPGKFAEMRRNQQAPLFSLAMRSRFDARPAMTVARLLRDEEFAILHTHTPRAALIGRIASAWAGVPMVHHVHSPTIADTTHRFKSWLNATSERASLRRTAALITVSQSLATYVQGRGIKTRLLRVVPNGVQVQGPLSPRKAPHSEWTLGTVALFRPRKGLEVLIDSLGELRAQGNRVRLRAVGEFETPDYKQEIMARVARLRLESAIEWTGFTREVQAELTRMDLFVLPSLFGEGMPMVVLEAMAAGVPIVATRVEGVPEVVRDGVDGVIVTAGDSQALSAGVKRLVRGELDWAELRDSAHRRQAESFSDQSMAAGVAAVYREILERVD